jgi:hypothetical protein
MSKEVNAPFEKCFPAFSYVLSPQEERFIKHVKEFEFLDSKRSRPENMTRREYARRMALKLGTFDRCGRSLCKLGLVTKISPPEAPTCIRYRIDWEVHDKLVAIVSMTRRIDLLTQFFNYHCQKLGKSISELTDHEIASLRK